MTRVEDRFKKDPAVVLRKIGDDFFLIPVRLGKELDFIYNFQETGAKIWELLDGQRNVAELSKLLSEEFGATPDGIRKDLLEFLGQLEQEGLIRHE